MTRKGGRPRWFIALSPQCAIRNKMRPACTSISSSLLDPPKPSHAHTHLSELGLDPYLFSSLALGVVADLSEPFGSLVLCTPSSQIFEAGLLVAALESLQLVVSGVLESRDFEFLGKGGCFLGCEMVLCFSGSYGVLDRVLGLFVACFVRLELLPDCVGDADVAVI